MTERRDDGRETIILGGGCFWCLEPVFRDLRGVTAVECGYAGGHVEHPDYEAVCRGDTGHAEVVKVEFDPAVIGLRDLLEVFFSIHDPTTPNRQGNDVGSQYRSVIFTTDERQAGIARDVVDTLRQQQVFGAPIVTELLPAPTYYPAEGYHQRYYEHHPSQGYCAVIIAPKLDKFRSRYGDRLKA
ncbi:MAG: peptide-methionine (S)-S-oxide reductase MsrA [Burkholderiaceae bacterium]